MTSMSGGINKYSRNITQPKSQGASQAMRMSSLNNFFLFCSVCDWIKRGRHVESASRDFQVLPLTDGF